MYEAFDAAGHRVYVTTISDCFGDDTQEGGLYCQIYADENFDFELDDHCIYPYECDCGDEEMVQAVIQEYVGGEVYDLSEYEEWLAQYPDSDERDDF